MKKVYTEDQKKLILDRYWAGEKASTINTSLQQRIKNSSLIHQIFFYNTFCKLFHTLHLAYIRVIPYFLLY